MAGTVGQSAIEYNLLGHRNAEDDAKVKKLSDDEVKKEHQKLLDESGEGAYWLSYNSYGVALDAEHKKRFGGGEAISTEDGLKAALNGMPLLGRFAGAIVEKSTGKDLGVFTISEPDFTGSRLGMPKKPSESVSGKQQTVAKKAQQLEGVETGVSKVGTKRIGNKKSSIGREGKQKRLRSLMNDDRVSSVDRGWLKQDNNQSVIIFVMEIGGV